jgi:hypothetical protein
MDIKEEFIKSVPTIPAKRILLLLLMLVPLSWWGLGEINPLWPNLDSKDLLIAKICLSLFLTSCFSIAANIYYIYKLKSLGKFIDSSIPELADNIARHEIQKFKSSNETK